MSVTTHSTAKSLNSTERSTSRRQSAGRPSSPSASPRSLGKSAGVFVLVKAHLQAWPPPMGGQDFWKHRGLAVIVNAGGLSPVLFCSCCFHDNSIAKAKSGPANLRMLVGLASYAKSINLQFCVGADWNMEPDVLAGTGFLKDHQWHVKCADSLLGLCVTNKGQSRSILD